MEENNTKNENNINSDSNAISENENNVLDENNTTTEKKKNYLLFLIFGILILIPIIFVISMFTESEKKEAPQTQEVTVTPEQELVNSMKIVETDSSESALANYALALINNKMYKKGIEINLKLLKMNPNNNFAYNNIGFAYGCIGDWDNGIKYCQMAIELDPSSQLAKKLYQFFTTFGTYT